MFYLYSIFLIMLFFEINQEINVVMKFFSSIIQNKEPDDVSLGSLLYVGENDYDFLGAVLLILYPIAAMMMVTIGER